MLASPQHRHYTHHTQSPPHIHDLSFLPKIPSPLSPRRSSSSSGGNTHGLSHQRPQQPIFSMSDKPQPPQSQVPYSQRAIKRAPAISQDALKERRRGMFLRKVREGREENRWGRRGEDMMRLDFVQRQRAWEAELARAAPSVGEEDIVEDGNGGDRDVFGVPGSSGGGSNAMQFSAPGSQQQQWGWQATQEEANEVAEREKQELDALLSLLPGEQMQEMQETQMLGQGPRQGFGPIEEQQGDEQMSEHFGSDDDDYDALFSDFINADAHEAASGLDQTQGPGASGDEMDMS